MMKKLLTVLLMLTMLCGLSATAFSASAEMVLGENLLLNPSFEDEDLYEVWYPHDIALIEKVDDASDAHDGKSFVKVSERQSSYDTPMQDITEILRENGQGRYYMSCWVKFEKNQDILPPGYPMNFNICVEMQCSDMTFGLGGKYWFSLFPEGPNGVNDVDEWTAVDSETTWVKVGGYVDIWWSKTLVFANFLPYSRTIKTEDHNMNEAYTFVIDDCELRKEVDAASLPSSTTKPNNTTTKPASVNTTKPATSSTSGMVDSGAVGSDTTDTNANQPEPSGNTSGSADNVTDATDIVTEPSGNVTEPSDDGTAPTTDVGNTDDDGGDKGDGIWLIVIIVAAVIIIAGGVIIFMLTKKKV